MCRELCNRCGECCRHGGPCDLRKWAKMPSDFDGTCDFLQDSGECRLMKQGPMLAIRQFFRLDGTCDFPHLRVSETMDGDFL